MYCCALYIQRLRNELHATSGQLTSRSFAVSLLKTSPLWQSSKWRRSSLNPQRSRASCLPRPGILAHECLDDFIPTITAIISEFLMSGIVPPPPPPPPSPSLQQAIALPLVNKKFNLEICLRIISSLHFSHIFENVVLQQLSDHLKATDTFEPFQSVYRTNTALKPCW